MASNDREIKIQVETVVSMINKIYQEQQAGKLTSAEAQSRAANYGSLSNVVVYTGQKYFLSGFSCTKSYRISMFSLIFTVRVI